MRTEDYRDRLDRQLQDSRWRCANAIPPAMLPQPNGSLRPGAALEFITVIQTQPLDIEVSRGSLLTTFKNLSPRGDAHFATLNDIARLM
jgi:hypothetical protein